MILQREEPQHRGPQLACSLLATTTPVPHFWGTLHFLRALGVSRLPIPAPSRRWPSGSLRRHHLVSISNSPAAPKSAGTPVCGLSLWLWLAPKPSPGPLSPLIPLSPPKKLPLLPAAPPGPPPAPHLAGLGWRRDRSHSATLEPRTDSTLRRAPALQIYIWRSPTPPPARPEKLLESWKSFRRAPLPRQKKPETSPKPPRLPPPPSAGSQPAPGSYCPAYRKRSQRPGAPCWAPRGPHDCGASGHPSTQLRLEFGPLR